MSCWGVVVGLAATSCAPKPAPSANFKARTSYAYEYMPQAPWAIHVIRLDRADRELQFHSIHAHNTPVGLSTLSDQIELSTPAEGVALAGINGDFYQFAGRPYAGDPRGIQIVAGELVSLPTNNVGFWIDSNGQPRMGPVLSLSRITWPNGTANAVGLNEPRRTNTAVLYTPALGWSTLTEGGRELVLEYAGPGPWPPLVLGETYSARVREVREGGDTRLDPEIMVLSLGSTLAARLPPLEAMVGATLQLSLATSPDLRSVKTAIGGGPILVRGGVQQWLKKPRSKRVENYEHRSMWERHPRTALGWNKDYFFLVSVDGRQKKLSAGMTLNELGEYLLKLGCQEAMNLDGGGSATMWLNGRIVNYPCDKREREIANSLIVWRKGGDRGAAIPEAGSPVN